MFLQENISLLALQISTLHKQCLFSYTEFESYPFQNWLKAKWKRNKKKKKFPKSPFPLLLVLFCSLFRKITSQK